MYKYNITDSNVNEQEFIELQMYERPMIKLELGFNELVKVIGLPKLMKKMYSENTVYAWLIRIENHLIFIRQWNSCTKHLWLNDVWYVTGTFLGVDKFRLFLEERNIVGRGFIPSIFEGTEISKGSVRKLRDEPIAKLGIISRVYQRLRGSSTTKIYAKVEA